MHLKFASDLGLRDGRWKLVSFRGGPWELYDIEADRTETTNVASEHPEVVERLSKQWSDTAAETLGLNKRQQFRDPPTEPRPKTHPEWTAFDQPLGETGKRARRKK